MEKNHDGTHTQKKKKKKTQITVYGANFYKTVSITLLKMLIVSTKHSVDVVANVLSGFIDF